MLFLADFNVIKPEPGLLVWTTIIFLLFWFLMSRFAFKPIGAALKQREEDIQGALDEAKKTRLEMSSLVAENEQLMAQAREERTQMLKEAKEAKEDIIAEAKERANAEYKRKVDSAIQDIENQKNAAMVDLKNKSGQLAIEIAEKVLRKELGNKSEQEAFAKSLADGIKLN
ncbi:MAG: F0F1 ATP synthase subunit B [Saprospiraceae bacterium]